MVKKYGPEPDNDKSHNASAVTNTDSTRERLVRFFEKYNKEKIDTVDKILVSYKGKEEQLFEALVKKYGPEPDNDKSHNASAVTNTDSTRERLVRFFEKYNKEKDRHSR